MWSPAWTSDWDRRVPARCTRPPPSEVSLAFETVGFCQDVSRGREPPPLELRMDREPTSSPPSAIGAQASKGLDAPSVARLLVEIGQRLVLAGENTYKARSYTRAAESLLLLSEPLEEIIAAGRLQEIPGVGAAL